MGKSFNNATLDKYFNLLNSLDDTAKKELIIRLTESLGVKQKSNDVSALFGSWEDERSAEEIIKDIRDSRI